MSKGTLILALAILLIGAVCGYMAGKGHSKPVGTPERQIDTLILRDTITREKPVYFMRYVRDTMMVAVTDTVRVHDTLYMSLDREVREYRDSTYYARVSGYAPSLDRIETYGITRVITEKVAQPVKRWDIGVQGGVGVVAPFGQKVSAGGYIGIGITYKIR